MSVFGRLAFPSSFGWYNVRVKDQSQKIVNTTRAEYSFLLRALFEALKYTEGR